LKTKLLPLVFALASIASAQIGAQTGSYPGPGVLSSGAGNIGAHSGEQLDLRLYASVDAVYDTGLQPFSLDPHGNLVQVNGLIGLQAAVGAYGVHNWRRARLGLDYHGTFRHYPGSQYYDGSDQFLQLGYSFQPTRHFELDMRALGGTSSFGLTSPLTAYAPVEGSVVAQPTLLLFDNRTYYLESGMDVNYLPTARTTITMGGSGYFVDHRAPGLVNMEGYDLHGGFTRRVSRDMSIGADYRHMHYDFPGNFGQADINQYTGRIARDFGRQWSASLNGGVFVSEIQSLQQVSFDPVIVALLGVSTGTQAFYRKDTYPAGDARLTRKFRAAQITLFYTLGVAPGNGVYLTSRQTSGGGTISYTGIRKWSFSLGGGYVKLNALGQNIQPYSQITGSAGVTYALFKGFSAQARYDARQQVIDVNGYQRTSYRAAVGITFSPGTIPISLW
jgi:hypothetical protein